jgi:minor extracellular protease Epr
MAMRTHIITYRDVLTGLVRSKRLQIHSQERFVESQFHSSAIEGFLDTLGIENLVSIEENKEFEYEYKSDIIVIGEPPEEANWGIDFLGESQWASRSSRGLGVSVGVADTGLDLSHPCFDGLRIKEFVDIDRATGARVPSVPYDSQWHGTFCTAILSGVKSNGVKRGLASQVDLFAAKVFNKFNSSTVAIHSAFEFFIENRVKIACFSLGAPKENIWLAIAQEYLETGGIIVAGIGNDYGGSASTISPANYPLSGLIAVGAHDVESNVWEKSGGDKIAYNLPDMNLQTEVIKPDICAPGVGIVSIGNAGKPRIESGTSFAVPHVAGILACMWGDRPLLKRNELLSEFFEAIKDEGDPGLDIRFGMGVIDATKLFLI